MKNTKVSSRDLFLKLLFAVEDVLIQPKNSKLKVTAADIKYIYNLYVTFDIYGNINSDIDLKTIQPVIFKLWAMSKRITAEHIPEDYHLITERLKALGFELLINPSKE